MLETILGKHAIRREAQENRRREPPANSVAHHNHMQVKQSHCPATLLLATERPANRTLAAPIDIYPKQNREDRLGAMRARLPASSSSLIGLHKFLLRELKELSSAQN